MTCNGCQDFYKMAAMADDAEQSLAAEREKVERLRAALTKLVDAMPMLHKQECRDTIDNCDKHYQCCGECPALRCTDNFAGHAIEAAKRALAAHNDTNDENCDEPCKACNRPTVQAARVAYRMGRKDARRYMDRSFGETRTDSATVDDLASLLWSAWGDGEQDPFEVIGEHRKTKIRIVVREAMTRIIEAAQRHLDECPDEPVSFEAIASAAEMYGMEG